MQADKGLHATFLLNAGVEMPYSLVLFALIFLASYCTSWFGWHFINRRLYPFHTSPLRHRRHPSNGRLLFPAPLWPVYIPALGDSTDVLLRGKPRAAP